MRRQTITVDNDRHKQLLFLHSEVHRTGEILRRIDYGSVFGGMTCTEAEALADVFRAAGDIPTAEHIINSHGCGDDDVDDDHHDIYLEICKENNDDD